MVDLRNLFPGQRPVIQFYPEVDRCCGVALQVQKTRAKEKAATLAIGSFVAKERVLSCPLCKRVYGSEELAGLIPSGCDFGYDIMVYVGQAVFLHCRPENVIVDELARKNVTISTSEVSYLSRKFIVYLALAHQERSPRIKEAIQQQGGYILHVDGTCDGDSPHLMTAIDEISNVVLDNAKVSTERTEAIVPFLERIKKSFGVPLATLRDLAKAIEGAFQKVFPGAKDFVCHFHFLRDIGKDLMGKEQELLRKALQRHGVQGALRKEARVLKHKIDLCENHVAVLVEAMEQGKLQPGALEQTPMIASYTLIQWALAGKKEGNGYGFPFDRPLLAFYQRIKTLHDVCEPLRSIYLRGPWKDNEPLYRICRIIRRIFADSPLRKAAKTMQQKALVFDRLRQVMRIADGSNHNGLNDDGEDVNIKTIEKRVRLFRQWLIQKNGNKDSKDYKKMVQQLDTYWEKLFADPITVDTPQGPVTIQPQRTNNILERFFRGINADHRRRTGKNKMSRFIKTMLADTPLVKNLKNPEYMKMVLNGAVSLEERFAQIDNQLVRDKMSKSREGEDKIPPNIMALIKKKNLPEIVLKLFEKSRNL